MARLIVLALALFVSLACGQNASNSEQAEQPKTAEEDRVQIKMETPMGNLILELYNETPLHRDNFVKLVEEGFYDETLFHRVIDGFMIQGGDPDSKEAKPGMQLGMGGPGYTIPAEFIDGFIHHKGALAAARQGDQVNPRKESSGSQFYIVHGRTFTQEELDITEQRTGQTLTQEQRRIYTTQGGVPHLDNEYTVFGRVTEGLEVVDKIAATQTDRANRPIEDIPVRMQVISK